MNVSVQVRPEATGTKPGSLITRVRDGESVWPPAATQGEFFPKFWHTKAQRPNPGVHACTLEWKSVFLDGAHTNLRLQLFLLFCCSEHFERFQLWNLWSFLFHSNDKNRHWRFGSKRKFYQRNVPQWKLPAITRNVETIGILRAQARRSTNLWLTPKLWTILNHLNPEHIL